MGESQRTGRDETQQKAPQLRGRRGLLASLIAVVILLLLAAAVVVGVHWGRADYARRHQVFLSADEYHLPVDAAMLTVQLVPLFPSGESKAQMRNPHPADEPDSHLHACDELELELARRHIEEVYGLSCEVGETRLIPHEFFDRQRQQYRIDKVLHWLIGECDPRAFRTVGVLGFDVFAPEFNYLFGQSTLGGNCCVASCARMTHGEGCTPEMARQRWHSIVVHELGHALGLSHNEDWDSVMAFGNSLSELDQQGTGLLKSDWQRLRDIHPIRWDRD